MQAGRKTPVNDRNVFLIGFMGAGKSTVGKLLAREMNRRFYDTDDLIEARCGERIAQIFQNRGERYFREIESKIVEEVAQLKDTVTALGGGAIESDQNRNLINSGMSVYLKWDREVLFSRIREDESRPLVGNNETDLIGLFESRRPFYERAHHIINCNADSTPKQSVDQIMTLIKENS